MNQQTVKSVVPDRQKNGNHLHISGGPDISKMFRGFHLSNRAENLHVIKKYCNAEDIINPSSEQNSYNVAVLHNMYYYLNSLYIANTRKVFVFGRFPLKDQNETVGEIKYLLGEIVKLHQQELDSWKNRQIDIVDQCFQYIPRRKGMGWGTPPS